MLQSRDETKLKLLCSTLKSLFIAQETVAFYKILGFSKEKRDDFKENLFVEFERISKKFSKMEKIQESMRKGRKPSPLKNLTICHPERIMGLVSTATKIHYKNIYCSWNRLRFSGSEKATKSSILRSNPNRLNGAIRHLSRSHETTSFMSSETPQRNKEHSRISISNLQKSDCCNEELLSAINFLNNL